MSQRDREHMRQRIAQRAAQILIDSGNQDFFAAKHKAAAQLGADDTRNLPKNSEIEQALREYQRLFRGSTQADSLQQLREVAIRAMTFLDIFRPRLVGSVLSGTADTHNAVILHVFAETVEDVGFYLMEHHIPYELAERRLKLSSDRQEVYPVYRFIAEEAPIELVVFLPGQHQAPLSPVDGRPMQRASVSEVEMLLHEAEAV